ncbi:hypothetical protein VHEMI06179 [[Torrubiella] hemipterigena]|uniref:Nudix hydrolase domain-containing protein n=1 Tax=[Torrubiella] hemipterigena TaxID=1531966 RepID=A0A0A1SZW9_9HYPO|nr:hypothetical protein VHEMI06179 [[Torrubiella] hemipterigena]
MSVYGAKLVSLEPLDNKDARWVTLKRINYTDQQGKARTWETAERLTRPAGGVDGVGILAILSKPDGKHILLQKQYRPPIDKVTIEIPAGLIDEGETPEQAAVRELREETGYMGNVADVSPVMFNDPGFCNTNLNMVQVDIDMSLEVNQNPVPQLEDDECIEVFSVPVDRLWQECCEMENNGYGIDARVGTFAQGIFLAQRLGL